MAKSLLYTSLVFIGVAWLWHAKAESFWPNAAEALGYNTVTLGLPILLLVFAAKRLYRSLRGQQVNAPYKITFGTITGSYALQFIPDMLNPSAPHRSGAAMCFPLFGVIATILLLLAYRNRHPLKTV